MLLFTHGLQRRPTQAGSRVTAHAVHPGYAATRLRGHPAPVRRSTAPQAGPAQG